VRRLLARLRADGGYTLVELIAVMAILLTILTALTTLFIAGAQAELDANKRFQAQQQARMAADRMRREVHCSSGVTVTSAAKITVKLPGHCPTAVGGAPTDVIYETVAVSGNRYELRRAGTKVADYLTTGSVFSYVAPSIDSLGKLHLNFPVNVNPNEGWKTWRLETDIVLRNTLRKNP
jgi:prepilin-type N-terminal cleavage/methylation domain-containing protein